MHFSVFGAFAVNHNFEETQRAWRQRAVEALPPTQPWQAGHTLVESVQRESREVRGEGTGQDGGGGEKKTKDEVRTRETHPSLPSMAAAPPGMILVMKIPGSSGMWGLSIPPAMLKPKPEFPCTQVQMHLDGGKLYNTRAKESGTRDHGQNNTPTECAGLKN